MGQKNGGQYALAQRRFFAGLQYYRTQNYPARFPEAVDYLASYNQINYFASDLNKTFPIYERTEATVETHSYLITNIKQDPSHWVLLDPHRNSWGLGAQFGQAQSGSGDVQY